MLMAGSVWVESVIEWIDGCFNFCVYDWAVYGPIVNHSYIYSFISLYNGCYWYFDLGLSAATFRYLGRRDDEEPTVDLFDCCCASFGYTDRVGELSSTNCWFYCPFSR